MNENSADHPTKWPQVYGRFCQWWLNRYGEPFDPTPDDLPHWEAYLAGWRAAGRSRAH